jgi:serine/threonine-protein kinase
VRVLLTDFGIARMTEDDTMTATGSILGSPSYMSPEQAKSGAISPASDVFSLGVTLYQMVTGRTPFPGKDPLTVIAALLSGEFLRPSQVEARVAPELEAVILRCLKRLPAERFADGGAAAAALSQLVSTEALGDQNAALRRFHEDRGGFERAIGGRVADAAVERARACVRRAELSKALAHLNRALAYVPDHRGATALLASISSRRRWVKGAAVAGALLAAGGAVAGLRGTREAPEATRAVAAETRVEKPATEKPVVAKPAAPAPAIPAAPPAAPVVAEAPPVAAPVRRRVAVATKRERAQPAPEAAATEKLTAAATPAPPPAAIPAAPSPPPAPPAPAPTPTPTAGITLRARQGFCSPSLGERVLAGTYELRAGTHPDLIIVRGADGRPTLGRPE